MSTKQIPIVPPPGNAQKICGLLGVRGADEVASDELSSIISHYKPVSEDGKLGIGLLVSAVFASCPAWSRTVDDVLRQYLGP